MTLNYHELFRALLPELALVVGALAVLTVDLVAGRGRPACTRLRNSVALGLLALAAAAYGTLAAGKGGPTFEGVFVLDALAFAVRLGVLALGVLTLGLIPGVARLRHPAEYVAIILFATAGFTLMAVAQQLLVAFRCHPRDVDMTDRQALLFGHCHPFGNPALEFLD